MDICFSLPRSIPAIAEKRTQKIAGMHSSKFVFYEVVKLAFDQCDQMVILVIHY